MSTIDYAKLNNERITSTMIHKYDQITAVSQAAINFQLKTMYGLNPTLQKLSVHLAGDDYAGLVASLAPSEVELQLDTDNRSVVFFLKLKSGTLNYWVGNGPSATKATLTFKDWIIALHVNLAFELKTTGFDSLPKNVQDRLKVLNNYSVQQLIIDFTSANIAIRDGSRTKIDIPSDNIYATTYFNLLMTNYFLERAKNTNDSVIHYLPRVNSTQTSYAVPTLPPTDLTFQNMPFIISTSDHGTVGPNTMLIYLQMTQNRPLPRELLPISANWVVPAPNSTTATYDGTVALSKGIFLDGWLMTKLVEFNRQSTWITSKASWQWNGWPKYQVEFQGHMGRFDATADDIKFIAKTVNDVPDDVKSKVEQPSQGFWYQYNFTSRMEDKHDTGDVWMQGQTTNWCFVRTGYNSTGKADIALIGKTRVEISDHVDISTTSGWVQGDWMIDLILDGVDQGELKIITNPASITPTINKGASDGWFHGGELTNALDILSNGLQVLSMKDIVSNLTNALGGSWDFCISGGEDFYIDKACFNGEQDLLCQLVYKTKA